MASCLIQSVKKAKQDEPGDRVNSISRMKSAGWRKHVIKSSTPPFERANHTAVVISGNMYVYGGQDSAGNILDDLTIFDLNYDLWHTPAVNRNVEQKNKKLQPVASNVKEFLNSEHEICPPPPARTCHTAVVHENNMIIMGGCPSELSGELYFFITPVLVWARFVQSSAPPEVKIPRMEHTAVVWEARPNPFMVICGGKSGQVILNSIIMFDLKKFKWSVLPANIPAVYGHSSFVRDDTMFIVGGYTETGCNSWTCVNLLDGSITRASSVIPEGCLDLNRALLTAAYDFDLDRIYLYMPAEKLVIIDIRNMEFAEIDSNAVLRAPVTQYGHTMALRENGPGAAKSVVVFGGCDKLPILTGEEVFCNFSNSVWEFVPPPQGADITCYTKVL